jgi:hypothetical protein
MKHSIDWDRGDIRFSYQSRYTKHTVSVALPPEVLSELAAEYGPFRQIPAQYEVTTSLWWDPVHPRFGTWKSRGVRVTSKTDHGCTIDIFLDPHGPMQLSLSLTRRKAAREVRGPTEDAPIPSPTASAGGGVDTDRGRPGKRTGGGSGKARTSAQPSREPNREQASRAEARPAGEVGGKGPEYLSAVDLKARGWTRTMIGRFLGEPDTIEPVNHFSNFSGKGMWLRRRVEQAEAGVAFQEYRGRLRRRSR